MLCGIPQKVQGALAASVLFPSRLGTPADNATAVKQIVEMLNGEVIRLDRAIRLAPNWQHKKEKRLRFREGAVRSTWPPRSATAELAQNWYEART